MKRFLAAAALAAVTTLVAVGTASADVPRYQTQTATFTVTQPADAVGQWSSIWTHKFTVTLNPCDNTFTGTGEQFYNSTPTPYAAETVSGTLGPYSISLTAVRTVDPVTWTLTNAAFGGPVTLATTDPAVSWPVEMKVTQPVITTTSAYKNHGAYVSANGGGADAAHSCIGRPMAWSQSGTVSSASAAGTPITLPDTGTYRIDVAGTWTNDSWGWVDAEYTNNGAGGFANGFDRNGYLLGEGFGDLQINGAFVDWGAFNTGHIYSVTTAFTGLSADLRVFDGDSNTATLMPWYGDNTGSLNYTISYVGP